MFIWLVKRVQIFGVWTNFKCFCASNLSLHRSSFSDDAEGVKHCQQRQLSQSGIECSNRVGTNWSVAGDLGYKSCLGKNSNNYSNLCSNGIWNFRFGLAMKPKNTNGARDCRTLKKQSQDQKTRDPAAEISEPEFQWQRSIACASEDPLSQWISDAVKWQWAIGEPVSQWGRNIFLKIGKNLLRSFRCCLSKNTVLISLKKLECSFLKSQCYCLQNFSIINLKEENVLKS